MRNNTIFIFIVLLFLGGCDVQGFGIDQDVYFYGYGDSCKKLYRVSTNVPQDGVHYFEMDYVYKDEIPGIKEIRKKEAQLAIDEFKSKEKSCQ